MLAALWEVIVVWQSSLFSCLHWKCKFNFHSAFVRQRSRLRNVFTVEFENACGKIFCEELDNTDRKIAGQIGRRAGAGSFFHGNLLHTRRLTFQRLQKRHPASSSVTFRMVSSVSD